MSGFFTENYGHIRGLSERLEKYSPPSEDARRIVALVEVALKAIIFNREEYDFLAQYTAARHGERFIDLIKDELNEEMLSRTLGLLGSFIREASLIRESRSESEQVVLDYFLGVDRDSNFDSWHGYDIDFVKNVLPARLLENQRRGLGQLRTDLEKSRSDALEEAKELELRIDGYRDQLKKVASDYNFVGLSHAFENLLSIKRSERTTSFWAMILLGLSALSLPFYLIFIQKGSLLQDAANSGWSPLSVSKLAASIGGEIVIIYYFRIALSGYLLVRNQITNLQLRAALCSFIEGYLDFSDKSAKSGRASAITAFESVIFGSLPSDDSKLPATLEGVEHIAKIAQSLRP